MSTLAVNAITDAAGGNTATINGMTPTAQSLQGFRNRIINGDMRIDQRNAGASVTVPDGSSVFSVDRFLVFDGTSGAFTAQRSTVAPSGFTNSMLITVTTADTSLASSERSFFQQRIEGFNTADLAWGTASAQPITVSFWVRSSVTGTYAASLHNEAYNRSYPFTYTVNSANTYELKTVTIPGDTTGTWNTTNGIGIALLFNLGSGSNFQGSANAWQSGELYMSSGTTQLVATNGATFYITGVQLEAGSVATPFERRPYGTELQLAQRYFQNGQYVGQSQLGNGSIGIGWPLMVEMRASPTGRYGATTAYSSDLTHRDSSGGSSTITGFTGFTPNAKRIEAYRNSSNLWQLYFFYEVSAEL